MLPAAWLLSITTLFNNVFMFATYPSYVLLRNPAPGKMESFLLFLNEVSVHLSIIINSVAQLYDMVLCDRLEKWFKPHREQAGSQAGRGCLEHIVTLRLLTDTARRKRLKHFVAFVDFTKAYDKVSRNIMLSVLKRLGCGMTMLLAIVGNSSCHCLCGCASGILDILFIVHHIC